MARYLTDWELLGVVDRAVLVTSELATNAVVHARTPFTLDVGWDGDVVLIQVSDLSDTLPSHPHGPSDHDNSQPAGRTADRSNGHLNAHSNGQAGRGLLLVEFLAVGWGITVVDRGKTVWATLR